MLLTEKHVHLSETVIGLSSFVIENLKEKLTLDELWKSLMESFESEEYPAKPSFEKLILTIDYLYTIGAIELDKFGRLSSEIN